jgi:hypothetical protein
MQGTFATMPLKRSLRYQSLESRRLLAAVDIPDTLSGLPGALISVPVNIDTAADVRGVEIRVAYDISVLTLDQSRVVAGSVWDSAADTQVTANVDAANGVVVVFVSSAAALGSVSGSLVEFGFTIASGAALGSTTVLDLTRAVLNEGQVSVTPQPQAGPDPTDGLLTIRVASGTDRIGGFVFADTNNNNLPEAIEGIAGVVITLINTSTGTQLQATTQADGRYEFVGLSPGTYTVRQQQPVAYIEGGVNEASVSLVAGQAATDQNFRELGLRPQFIYNRLLTTLVLPVGSPAWVDQIIQINDDARAGVTAPVGGSAASASTPDLSAAPSAEGVSAAPPAEDSSSASSVDVFSAASSAEGESPLFSEALVARFGFAEEPKEDEDDQQRRALVVDELHRESHLW